MKTVHVEEGVWREAKRRALERGVSLERVVNDVLASGLGAARAAPAQPEAPGGPRLAKRGTVTYGELDETF